MTLLTINEVAAKLRMGKSTIWLKVREGKFPKPLHTGIRARAWKESDIENWINNLGAKPSKEAFL